MEFPVCSFSRQREKVSACTGNIIFVNKYLRMVHVIFPKSQNWPIRRVKNVYAAYANVGLGINLSDKWSIQRSGFADTQNKHDLSDRGLPADCFQNYHLVPSQAPPRVYRFITMLRRTNPRTPHNVTRILKTPRNVKWNGKRRSGEDRVRQVCYIVHSLENVVARVFVSPPSRRPRYRGIPRATENEPPFYLNDVFSSSLILKRLQYI